MLKSPSLLAAALVGAGAIAICACSTGGDTTNTYVTSGPTATSSAIQHVLLISIDGMRQADYDWMIKNNPTSNLASLAGQGVVFQNAYTTFPSDSYPGLMAQITGGTPKSTGIYYDHTFDSTMHPSAAQLATGVVSQSHEILYDESLTDPAGGNALGTNKTMLVARLPLDASNNPVYPHSYLKVNTIFEVLHNAGMVTAWSDKHPAYEICNGPSGTGVVDLFTPEIRSPANADGSDAGTDWTATVPACNQYDDSKVAVVINWIDGKKSVGGTAQAVPAVFGMNFQAVSVAQKICASANKQIVGSRGQYGAVVVTAGKMGGYATSTPGVVGGVLTPNTDTLGALMHVDASIGSMINELKAKNLWSSTLVIISAKHGQGGMDPATVDKTDEANIMTPILGGTLPSVTDNGVTYPLGTYTAIDAQACFSDDDVGIIWLNDKTQVAAAVTALTVIPGTSTPSLLASKLQSVLTGSDIAARYGNLYPNRLPDIILYPKPGVLFSTSGKKNSDHGGPSDDDTHVMCLVANPNLIPNKIMTRVNTTQIAPTILQQLGQNPQALQAVVAESTPVLPGIAFGSPTIPTSPN